MNKGAPETIFNAIAGASSPVKRQYKGYNALLVHHYMTGVTSGGYVGLKMGGSENSQFIAHHGKGTNIKSANVNASYTCLFEGIMDWVEITLNRTDGTHTVIIQPVNI